MHRLQPALFKSKYKDKYTYSRLQQAVSPLPALLRKNCSTKNQVMEDICSLIGGGGGGGGGDAHAVLVAS